MKENTCFFTGHRDIPASELIRIRNSTYMLCKALVEKMNIRCFICGGALGFDTLAAQVVLRLKEQYPMVRLHLALPCKDQQLRWSAREQQTYRLILSAADCVEYVSEEYTPYCMHARNRYMVEKSCCGIAFLRKMSGGTAYTVKYAKSQDVKLFFVDSVVQKMQQRD